MVALVFSFLVLLAGLGVVRVVASRKPRGTSITWAEAVIAATCTLGLMLLAYGIIPHLWLSFADNELKWRADSIAYNLEFFGRGRIAITKEAVRDVIATLWYVVGLGVNVALWSWWQKRPTAEESASAQKNPGTSRFGRPLVRKA